MKTIPIVYATNDSTCDLCSVSIASIIENASKSNVYRIYVFYSRLMKKNRAILENMSTSYVVVRCINIKKYVNYDNLYELERYPYEIYYRFYASMILDFEKIIYLDCDTLILEDIAILFAEELECPIGAVTDYCYYLGGSNYFNSGVLLINKKLFELEKIREKCLALIKEGTKRYLFPDQDTLNIICKNHRKILNPKFNYQMHVAYLPSFLERKKTKLKSEFSCAPVIVHYSYLTKPYQSILSSYNQIFWKYARNTEYFDCLVDKYLNNPYEVLQNSFLPEMYLNEVLKGRVGLSKIIKVFLHSIRYWFLFKIRGEENENKKNNS